MVINPEHILKLVLWSGEDGNQFTHLIMPAHLSILLNIGRGIRTETCVMDTVFPLNSRNLFQVLKEAYLRYQI